MPKPDKPRMERRLTGFLLPVLVLVLVYMLFFREKPAQPGHEAPPAAPPLTQEQAQALTTRADAPATRPARGQARRELSLGKPGEKGAFQATFDSAGAALVRLRLLDHSAEPGSLRQPSPPPEAYYALVDEMERGMWSVVLEEEPGRVRQFPLTPLDGGVDPRTGQPQRWDQEDLEDGVRFSLELGGGLTLVRTYRHVPGKRELLLGIQLRASTARPDVGAQYRFILRGPTLPNPKADWVFGNPAVAFGRVVDQKTQAELTKVVRPEAKEAWTDLVAAAGENLIDFAGVSNRFFAAFLYPDDRASREALYSVHVESVPPHPQGGIDAHSVPRALYSLRLRVPDAGSATELNYRLYLGPKSARVFGEDKDHERFAGIIEHDLNPGCFCTIPGSVTMGRVLLWLLNLFHDLVSSWGVAIMMLTVLVRGSLVPLNLRMQRSMRAFGEKMARLKPEMEAIQKRYAKDPKKQREEMAVFQRKHKLFPPLGGCLPIFITMPIFIGLFAAIRAAYELRHQPFFLWIEDLSQADQLFHIGLPWVPHFNLLPLVWIGLFLILQLKMPLPSDPQQRQVAVIMRYMPVLFGVMLYNYASGLMVYMVTSAAWSLVEQKITLKILGPMRTDTATPAPMPMF
ncbi:MAG: membrane protein insertase YidC [Planctomycetes bacterium]|nr:membrane protein insertase YidC [Planctomycetota bacterium]